MNVLVGCEYSGIVRDAFLDAGHYALSCDLLESDSDKGDHWKGDIFKCLYHTDDWDLIILHPPCTHLCVSGNRWYGKGQSGYDKRLEAIEWTALLWKIATQKSTHVVLENPVGVLSTHWRPPDQYFQPYEYGHKQSKKTGLWLTPGVPKLVPTDVLELPDPFSPEWQEWQKVWRCPPGPDRGKIRSRFFEGVASAMVEQWAW